MSAKSIVKAIRIVSEILGTIYGISEKPVDLKISEVGRLVTFSVKTEDAADVRKLVASKLQFIFASAPAAWGKLKKAEGEVWSVRTDAVRDQTLVEVYFQL